MEIAKYSWLIYNSNNYKISKLLCQNQTPWPQSKLMIKTNLWLKSICVRKIYFPRKNHIMHKIGSKKPLNPWKYSPLTRTIKRKNKFHINHKIQGIQKGFQKCIWLKTKVSIYRIGTWSKRRRWSCMYDVFKV